MQKRQPPRVRKKKKKILVDIFVHDHALLKLSFRRGGFLNTQYYVLCFVDGKYFRTEMLFVRLLSAKVGLLWPFFIF